MTTTRPLHWEALPNGIIEGLTDAEINALLDDFDLEKASAELSSDVVEQLLLLEKSVDELHKACAIVSTEYQERQTVKRLTDFVSTLQIDIATCEAAELARVLRLFYGTLKKANGDCYSPASLICIHAALCRYFARNRASNIIADKEFFSTNETLKNHARKFVTKGGRSKPFEAIGKDDLQRLKTYFDRSNPLRLQQEVYFSILYYFGNRGREAFRNLTPESFVFEERSGVEVVRIRLGKLKCLGNELSADSARDTKDPVMIATNSSNCPVAGLKLYLQQHAESTPSSSSTSTPNNSLAFFLKPNPKNWQSGVWYYQKQPMGLNSIGNYMRDISKAAGLSKVYTGHCVRATVVAELFNAGHSPADIAAVTGHKDSRSVERCLKNSKRAEYKTVEMSRSLVESLTAGGDSQDSPEMLSKRERFMIASQDVSMNPGGSGDIGGNGDKKSGNFYFSHCTVHFH